MKKMKQILGLALSLTVMSTAVAPKRSEAIIGLATGNVPTIIVGAAILGAVSVPAFTVSIVAATQGGERNLDRFAYSLMIGVFSGLGGLLILDESEGGLPQFQTLSSEQQARLSIASEDYAIYESELEEISAAIDSGAAKAIRAEVQTIEEAKSYFDAEYGSLSPETRSVMAKIVHGNFKAEQN